MRRRWAAPCSCLSTPMQLEVKKIHRFRKIETRTDKSTLQAEIAEAIARIADLDRDGLVKRWQKRFGVEPPKGCGRRLLELAAAYDIQEQAFGGLKPEIR